MSGFRRLRIVAPVLAGMAVLAAGCVERTPRPPVETKPEETAAGKPRPSAKPAPAVERAPASETDVAGVVEGNNAFAFDLYARLKTEDGNLIFSPYSISTALAMTYAGARGETASQMEKTLRFALGQEKLHPAMADLVDDLNARGGKGAYELVAANRLWGQTGHRFLEPFLALNRTCYGAGLEQVDFARATEQVRKTINDWIEDRTREKIKDLLKPGVIDPLTTLVLTNAIYFKGNWTSQFKKEDTRDAPFHVTPRKTVDVPLMHQTATFGYTEAEGLQILELPYVGDELAMVVLLPKKADGLAEVEASLGRGSLKTWLSRLQRLEVAVSLPKFKIEFDLDLAKTLAAMGMPMAFGGGADFSGIDGTRSLSIAAVIHKAYVDVNEQGTEAAAATAVVMTKSMPPVFSADRPFLFVIRDRATGSVLFIGRVADPSA